MSDLSKQWHVFMCEILGLFVLEFIQNIFSTNVVSINSTKVHIFPICKLCVVILSPSAMVAVWFTFENIPSVILDSIIKRQLSNKASLVASFWTGVKQRTVKRQI